MSPAAAEWLADRVETVPALFAARVKLSGNKVAYRFHAGHGWRSVTWDEVWRRVDEIALGLWRLGVRPGDPVAVVGQTRAEWCLTDLAIMRVGGCVVAICPTVTPAQLATELTTANCRHVVIQGGTQLAKLHMMSAQLAALQHVVVWEVEGSLREPQEVSLFSLSQQGRQASDEDRAALVAAEGAIAPDATATILFTAGTTGEPKAAELTHRSIMAMLRAMKALPIGDFDSTVAFMPMCHAAEKIVGFYGRLASGMSAGFARSFEFLVDDIEQLQPTVLGGVPRLFERIYDDVRAKVSARSRVQRRLFDWYLEVGRQAMGFRLQGRPLPPFLSVKYALAERAALKGIRDALGASLRFVLVGAGPIRREVLDFFMAAGVVIHEAYGLTECSGLATANLPEQCAPGTVGKALPGVELRLGTDSEVLLRGPSLFKGYLGAQTPAQSGFDGDGWLHTGDIGRFDPNGFLVITDRKKNILITAGGKSVSPHTIEDLLCRDRAISHTLVVGDGRPYLSALIALSADEAPQLAERLGLRTRDLPAMSSHPKVLSFIQTMVDQVNQDLSPVEQVRKFALLPVPLSAEDGELTATQQVCRNVVLSKYSDLVEQMYR